MKVVQVLLHEGIGGMETLARGLEEHLPAHGWTVETVFLDRGLHAGDKTGRLTRLRGLRRALAAESPSVVLSHSALPNIYSRLGAPRGVPVVTVLHGPNDWNDPQIRWAERFLSRRTAAVVAVSGSQVDDYRRAVPSPRVPLYVIPNGVKVPILGEPRPMSADAPTLLAVCRLVPTKHLHTLLQACSGLASTGQDFRLLVLGDGPDHDYVRSLHDTSQGDPGLRHRVHWLGARGDIEAFMREADLLVHPSVREAHSLTLLEAAVHGLPVILSDSVAHGLAADPIVGRVFSGGSAASLAATLRQALSDLRELRSEAWERAPAMREKYSIENTAARYAQLLVETVTSASGGRD